MYDGEAKSDELLLENSIIDINKVSKAYPLTKIVCERILNIAHIEEQLNSTILRFGMVYGPRKKPGGPVEGIFKEIVEKGEVEMFGSVKTARRFTHVNDIISGIILYVGLNGFNTFNLCGDNLISLEDVIKTGSKILNIDVSIKQVKAGERTIRNPSNAKIKKSLKLKSSITLSDGLKTLM